VVVESAGDGRPLLVAGGTGGKMCVYDPEGGRVLHTFWDCCGGATISHIVGFPSSGGPARTCIAAAGPSTSPVSPMPLGEVTAGWEAESEGHQSRVMFS
jgi:hypothetical protein